VGPLGAQPTLQAKPGERILRSVAHFARVTCLEGSPTKFRSNKRRMDKTSNDKTSNGTKCRMPKCRMRQNVEHTKYRMSQNVKRTKYPT
jgi:hypothetical protein